MTFFDLVIHFKTSAAVSKRSYPNMVIYFSAAIANVVDSILLLFVGFEPVFAFCVRACVCVIAQASGYVRNLSVLVR